MRISCLECYKDINSKSFNGKIYTQKNKANYRSALNVATSDVIDSLANKTCKIQKAYENFLNNWVAGQNKALQILQPLAAVVTFFSNDKSEKLTLLGNGKSAILEDKSVNKYVYENGCWDEAAIDIENTLAAIVDNNLDDVVERAKLMYSLSDIYLAKFFNEQNVDDSIVHRNLHNLIECVTNIYDTKQALHICIRESHQNTKNDSEKIFTTYDQLKFFSKGFPKYSVVNGKFMGFTTEELYDSKDNIYEKRTFYGQYGNERIYIKANIKGFGEVIRDYYSLNGPIYHYTIYPENKNIARYEFTIKEDK